MSYLAEVGGYVGLFLGLSFLQLFGYMGHAFQHLEQKLVQAYGRNHGARTYNDRIIVKSFKSVF